MFTAVGVLETALRWALVGAIVGGVIGGIVGLIYGVAGILHARRLEKMVTALPPTPRPRYAQSLRSGREAVHLLIGPLLLFTVGAVAGVRLSREHTETGAILFLACTLLSMIWWSVAGISFHARVVLHRCPRCRRRQHFYRAPADWLLRCKACGHEWLPGRASS